MRLLLILAVTFPAAPAWSQQTGSLKVRFAYGGPAPGPQPIVVDKDIQFCGVFPLTSERLSVNAENGGIKNVVLSVYTGRGGSKLPPQPNSDQTVELAARNCRFDPHIVYVQVGDTLRISIDDVVGHNPNVNFFANHPQGRMIGPRGPLVFKIMRPEPTAIPIDCNIHPWMRAYLIALDHPFAGISDDNGMLKIEGLPADETLVFRLFHEAAPTRIEKVLIEGEPVELNKNLLELMIEAGENDLGTITIPAAALKP